MTSIKPRISIFTVPPTLLFTPTFEHYNQALKFLGIFDSIINSLVIGFLTTFITLVVAVPAGYAYARLNFKLKRTCSFFTLFTQMAPQIGVLIPFFLIVHRLRIYDSFTSLVMIHLTITVPVSIWLMITYFQSIPKEMEESALVDGASYFTAFYKIVLPQAAGGVAVCAILAFIDSWNEFLFASILTGRTTRTVSVAIFSFLTTEESLWGPFTATGMMIMAPVIVITLFAQKRIVKGLTFGAVKE
jgi:multiple sugar transport system permease protein